MDPHRRSLKIIVLSLVVGAIIGSILGDVAGAILPDGVVRDFFLLAFDSSEYGLREPFVLDFHIFSITFGLTLRVNFTGLLGMGIAFYLLRYYRV